MKKAMTMLLAVGLMLTAAGCGSSSTKTEADTTSNPAATTAASKDPVKLRVAWWGGQARNDYTLKVIEMYEKAHPNVKIEPEYAAFDDYWKKLAPEAAANQLPDVISMDISYLSQYAGRDQLEDLTSYTKNGQLDISSISPNSVSGGQMNGKLYALTIGVNALATLIDPAMLKAAGVNTPLDKNWTWDDVDQIAAKLKASGKQLGGIVHHDVFLPYYLRTAGQTMYSADGTSLGYADDKPFIDYFKRYQKWYDAGYLLTLDKQAQKKGTPEDDEMVLGHAFSNFAWSNQYLGFFNAANRPLDFQPMPGPDSKKGMFLKPSMYMTVSKSSKQKEEAVKFINFFVNDIEANKIIKGERGVPVSSKVKDALKPLLKPEEAAVFDYVAWAEQNSSPMDPPNPIGSIEVEKLLKDISEQILYKKISVEDGAAKFRKEANAILAKNKK
jgi:multiple sugar transport system substrate-binding protein